MADGVREHSSPVGLGKEPRSLIAMYKSTIKTPVEKPPGVKIKKCTKNPTTKATIRPITRIKSQPS